MIIHNIVTDVMLNILEKVSNGLIGTGSDLTLSTSSDGMSTDTPSSVVDPTSSTTTVITTTATAATTTTSTSTSGSSRL